MRKKIIAILMIAVFMFPLTVFLKPAFAVDEPVLEAKVEVRGKDDNKKQIYTVKWEVPGGQYWAQTPRENYTAVYRSQNADGTYSDWQPVTVKNTARLVQPTKLKGSFQYQVPNEDFGKGFQFGFTVDSSLQSGSIVDDNAVMAKTEIMTTKTEEEVQDTETPETQNVLVDTGNVFERILGGIVMIPVTVIKSIGVIAEFQEIDELVFTRKPDVSPWTTQEQKDKVYDWFQALMWATMPFFVFVISYNGFKMMYASANPMARVESMEGIQRWFFALGLIIIAPVFLNLVMTVSGLLTDAISVAFTSITGGDTTVHVLDKDITTGSILGTAIVQCLFVMLYFYFNVIYIVRMVAISVMFAFTPLMAIMWAIKKDVTAASVWIGELASNAFMPVAHALVICTILLLINNIEGSWVHELIMFYCLLPLSEVLRNSMMSVFTRASGLNEQHVGMGALGAVMGLGGLVSMGRMGGAMFGGSRMAKGGALAFSKGATMPQTMANPLRTISDKGLPIGGLSKMNYGNIGDKGMYIRHNWDRKNPMPTGLKSPTKPTGRVFSYKQPDNNDTASMLSTSIRTGNRAGMAMAGPAAAIAGAVPGGKGVAAGMYAGSAGLIRGAATAGIMGRNIMKARKETGSMGLAMRKVTGATTMKGAVKSMAGTVGGSVFNPTGTLNKAIQEKKKAESARMAGMAARKARLDARKNPIQFNKKTNTQQANQKYNYVHNKPGTAQTKPNPTPNANAHPNRYPTTRQRRHVPDNPKLQTKDQLKVSRPRRPLFK